MSAPPTLLGTAVNRVDARKKVTGAALYAADTPVPNVAHAVMVGATVAAGRITHLDVSQAEDARGVLLVLTHENRGPLARMPDGSEWPGMTTETGPPLADDHIHYYGQYVAMVVAETLEQARHAASLIKITYHKAHFTTDMKSPLARVSAYQPLLTGDEDLRASRGNPSVALRNADVRIDATYTTPNEHPCALEPHATVASWADGTLKIFNSTQWVKGDHAVLTAAFKLPPDKVRIISPFVGGMFGSKVATGWHTVLAAIASLRIDRPVKVVLSRQQVLTNIGHRTETRQRLQIGAWRDGPLHAIRHRTKSHSAKHEAGAKYEFYEPTSGVTRMLYACPHYLSEHEAVRMNLVKPGWMRAPGEAPGSWALETAMDELAYELNLDPVDLRRRNHTGKDPHLNLPFASKHLLDCYDRGAERFGWERRNPKPASMRNGDDWIGWGMATASHPGWLMGATVRVRLDLVGGDVHATVSTAGIDVGTGMYTMIAMTAAEGLGLPLDAVTPELGDSGLPDCAPAGGSNLTASTAPAIVDACRQIRRLLLLIASSAGPDFKSADERPDDFVFADATLAPRSNPAERIRFADLLEKSGKTFLSAEARTKPKSIHDDRYAYHSFGAHFIEVRVDRMLGCVRVSRIVSVFDVGRVLSAKTARSQLIGGIVFGIGQALLEELIYDRKHGHPVNADLAGYLVPVHADVPDIDVSWIDKPDPLFNSVGCRGVGEIGITGVAAAIGNAVHHAIGIRVRDLPITPDKLL